MNPYSHLTSFNNSQMRSILPFISNDKKQILVNRLIEDFLLHNLTDSQSLILKPGVVSIDYMSDSNYFGEVSDQQTQQDQKVHQNHDPKRQQQNASKIHKQGRGVYRYSNNDIYMGDWHNDALNGLGMYIFSNGNIYRGLFHNGNSTKGILNYANGQIYQGQFKDGLRHGLGIMKYKKQNKSKKQQQWEQYNGEWKNDYKNGKGLAKCRNYIIEGLWEDDKINGQVLIKTKPGLGQNSFFLQYKGLMSDDQLVKGHLKVEYNKNNYYEGEIYQGKFQGIGKYVQPIKIEDKTVIYEYQGEFKKGSIEGRGRVRLIGIKDTISQNILSEYQGLFQSHSSNSGIEVKGKITYMNGDQYKGLFKKGLKNGAGIYWYKNGDIYQGEFINDRIQGHGRYIWANRLTTYQGKFKNGGIVQGKGKLNDQIIFSMVPEMHKSIIGNGNRVGRIRNLIQNRQGSISQYPQLFIRPRSISPGKSTKHRYINIISNKINYTNKF